jgi:hypothetical protein
MIGIAALVKLSGLIPALVMLVLVARKRRDALARFVVGAALAFGVACIGFLAAAPSAFFREVFYYPLLPESSRQPGASWTFLGRGKYLAYTDFRPIADLFPSNRQVIALWIAVVVAVLIVLAVVLRRKVMTSLEWFAVWSLALVTPALLSSPHAFTYYLYFQAPFLALVGGSLDGRASRTASPGVCSSPPARSPSRGS